jgi:hypothetical protein
MILWVVSLISPKTRGRKKLSRNHRTLDAATLRKIASDALVDGRLCVTPEKLGFCLQIAPSTVNNLIQSGTIPVFFCDDDLRRRWPRILVLDLLEWLDNRA